MNEKNNEQWLHLIATQHGTNWEVAEYFFDEAIWKNVVSSCLVLPSFYYALIRFRSWTAATTWQRPDGACV